MCELIKQARERIRAAEACVAGINVNATQDPEAAAALMAFAAIGNALIAQTAATLALVEATKLPEFAKTAAGLAVDSQPR